jgi:ABC-type multidrug transport system ATPase subunit
MTETVLSTDDIHKQFGSVTVLEGISIEVEAGTLTGIIGPNGSGKTTLLEILIGLSEPTSGTVSHQGPENERQIGYLPQHPAFRPGFTVGETLDFYTALANDDPEALLERVGLADATDRRVEALSGGMTRLLGLAQAMVGDPPVVILDEPASGLDPGMRKRTYEVASTLAADGTAVLVSSHDLDLIGSFCDRVALIDSGVFGVIGQPDTLCTEYDCADLWELFETTVERPEDAISVSGVTE